MNNSVTGWKGKAWEGAGLGWETSLSLRISYFNVVVERISSCLNKPHQAVIAGEYKASGSGGVGDSDNYLTFLKNSFLGTSLVVQWLRRHSPNIGGPGLIPGQGTRSHMS